MMMCVREVVITGLIVLMTVPFMAQDDLSVARELFKEGDYESVISHLVSFEIRNVPDLLLEADAHHKLSDYEQAVVWYTQVLAREEDHPQALMRRGAAYLEMGQFGWALKDVKDALRISPSECKTSSKARIICYDQEDLRNAVKYYKAALDYKPNYPQARYMLGASKAMQGDARAASREFASVVDDLPNSVYNLAVVSLESDDYDQAIAYFEQLEGMDFKLDKDFYFLKAEALYFEGDKQLACLEYEKAAELGDEEAADIYDNYCLKNKKKPTSKKREAIRIQM
ncbi:MAG: tetratricopeptide repeat protein [Bacteroidetes bacterium]|nr:tetratricopeptide repeat protein [Bacteroidota bacterium]